MAFAGPGYGSWQPDTPSAGPRRRRWGRIIAGVLALGLAVLLLIGGFVVLIGSTQWDAATPQAEGNLPGSVTLDAEADETYVVALGAAWDAPRRSFNTDFALDVRCTITHPDGDDEEIRGDRQGSAVTRGGRYATIGTFDGRGGEATVACASTGKNVFGEEVDLPFLVHDRNGTLRVIWIVLFVAAAVVGVVGGLLLASGIRGRPAVA